MLSFIRFNSFHLHSVNKISTAILFWLLTILFWLLTILFWLLTILFWLLTILFWLLTISFWLLTATFKQDTKILCHPVITSSFSVTTYGRLYGQLLHYFLRFQRGGADTKKLKESVAFVINLTYFLKWDNCSILKNHLPISNINPPWFQYNCAHSPGNIKLGSYLLWLRSGKSMVTAKNVAGNFGFGR